MTTITKIVLTLLVSGTIAHSDTFGVGSNQFNIDFVPIGNGGNGNDAGTGGSYGGVAYDYRMGTHEISQGTVNAAVAGGLTGMTAGYWNVNQPSTNLSWYQAAGFVNWLNTSMGYQSAYRLNPTMTALTLWSSAEAWQYGGENLYRHKDAYYFLPSEDEWYKAAYHKNEGITADYWNYPTASNAVPMAVASGQTAGTAVYHLGAFSFPSDVSLAGGLSSYGTMAQGGNAYEWTESASDGVNSSSSEYRSFRGGFWNITETYLRSSSRNYNYPSVADWTVGFRVASVPEPSSAHLLIFAVGLLVLWVDRKR